MKQRCWTMSRHTRDVESKEKKRTESSADSLTGFTVERNGLKPLEFGACILKYKTSQHFLNHGDYPHQDRECLLCLRLLGWKLLRLNSGH